MTARHSCLAPRIVKCVDFEVFQDLFPELTETAFFQEFLDWMDVSSGDSALTLVKMADFRFSMKDFMKEITFNLRDYNTLWGIPAVRFILFSTESPIATLERMDDDLYINLED